MGPPSPRAEPRHGWVWAALPAGCEHAMVEGDPGLAELLRDTGVEVDGVTPRRADAILLTDSPGGRSRLDALAAQLRPGAVLAVAVGGREGARVERPSRVRRAFAELGSLSGAAAAWLAAARVARRLRARGLAVMLLGTGDRSRRHELGLGRRPWLRGHMARGVIVIGAAGTRSPTVLERGLEAAGRVLGAPPRIEDARVLSSGIVQVGLDAERPVLLRVAGGPSRALLTATQATLSELVRVRPPRALTQRLPVVISDGDLGLAAYTLERRLPGDHPHQMSPRLWEQCLEFLAALRALPGSPSPPPDPLAEDVRTLAPHVSAEGRATLAQLEPVLRERLADVPLGWAHGDFWPRNLLACSEHLVAVLDWDAASPATLPLLDLFHLIALSDPRLKRMPHGERCRRVLWPLARAGGDARIRAHSEAIGTPHDPATLEALALAYWLTRVARDLRTFADRAARSGWMEDNVHRPLAALAAWPSR